VRSEFLRGTAEESLDFLDFITTRVLLLTFLITKREREC
jgi:hypothetical protein